MSNVTKARVRWTSAEREALIHRVAAIRARQPTQSLDIVLEEAQRDVLPVGRHRKFNHALKVWVLDEIARLGSDSGATPGDASEDPSPPVDGLDPGLAADDQVAVTAALPAAHGEAPASDQLVSSLAEVGSQVLRRLLSDVRVRDALRDMMREVLATPLSSALQSSAKTADATAQPSAGVEQGPLKVLIAGLPAEQAAQFRKTYAHSLDVRSWSIADGLESLERAAGEAEVVIGMSAELNQPTENSLRKVSRKYIGHTRGISGLRTELADLVMQGP
jgi:hypothetical protein